MFFRVNKNKGALFFIGARCRDKSLGLGIVVNGWGGECIVTLNNTCVPNEF